MAKKLNNWSFRQLKTQNYQLENKVHFTFVFFGDSRDTPINKKILGQILNEINNLKSRDLAIRGTIDNLEEFRNFILQYQITQQKKVSNRSE